MAWLKVSLGPRYVTSGLPAPILLCDKPLTWTQWHLPEMEPSSSTGQLVPVHRCPGSAPVHVHLQVGVGHLVALGC